MSSETLLFSASGEPFGQFGENIPASEAVRRIRYGARTILAATDLRQRYSIESTFYAQDGGALDPNEYSLPMDQTSILPWIVNAGQRDLLKFRTQMQERHTALNAALSRNIPQLAQRGLDGLMRMVNGGIIGRDVYREVEKAFETVPITAMSSFEAGELGADAVCEGVPGQARSIRIANLFNWTKTFKGTSPEMTFITLHEGLHAAGFNRKAGFTTGLTKHGQPTGLVEEIGVAHLQASAANGWPHTFMPVERKDIIEVTYATERRFFGYLAGQQAASVDPQLLYGAQFSPLDETADRPGHPRRELEQRLQSNMTYLFSGKLPLYDMLATYEAYPVLTRPEYVKGLLGTIMMRGFDATPQPAVSPLDAYPHLIY